MTARQAMAEARRRWGQSALIEDGRHPVFHTRKDGTQVMLVDRYKVGKVMLGMFFEVRGDGPTWEAAFEKANKF